MQRISYIIPVRNGAQFITYAIQSILDQNPGVHEIIVVDDGSTDSTADSVNGMPKVRYVRQEPLGPGAARNHGLRLVTGDYVCFLDSDDLVMPTHDEKLIQHIHADPSVDAVVGATLLIRYTPSPEPSPVILGVCRTLNCFMIKTSSLQGCEPFTELQRAGEETNWLIGIKKAGRVVQTIPDELAYYRRRKGSCSSMPPWKYIPYRPDLTSLCGLSSASEATG